MDETLRLGQEIGRLHGVVAVAIGGSLRSANRDELSDTDFYAFTSRDVPAAVRDAFARSRAKPRSAVIAHEYFGGGDLWHDRRLGLVEAMFWSQAFIEDQLDKVLVRHEPSYGYSTSFVHTISASRVACDPTGWYAELKARTDAYPDATAQAIIAHNWPLLRDFAFSYRHQIQLALHRGDRVSVNHRVAALLASYFDIVFAVNRVWHPGEKRQVEKARRMCAKLPGGFERDLSAVLEQCETQGSGLLRSVDRLIDRLASAYDLKS